MLMYILIANSKEGQYLMEYKLKLRLYVFIGMCSRMHRSFILAMLAMCLKQIVFNVRNVKIVLTSKAVCDEKKCKCLVNNVMI